MILSAFFETKVENKKEKIFFNHTFLVCLERFHIPCGIKKYGI
jgi:hypothetical protein